MEARESIDDKNETSSSLPNVAKESLLRLSGSLLLNGKKSTVVVEAFLARPAKVRQRKKDGECASKTFGERQTRTGREREREEKDARREEKRRREKRIGSAGYTWTRDRRALRGSNQDLVGYLAQPRL